MGNDVSIFFSFIKFADDKKLFCTIKDTGSLSVAICNELMKLEKGVSLNKFH